MNVGSLFSGVGGFDLGLERAGMRVIWQCESDEYCRRVLAKHWPDVPCFEDVRDIDERAPAIDVLCGGFPCQPVSLAGRGLAQADERWLWPEFARVIRDLRPGYVLVENVPGLLGRGFGDVLGDLASLGYDSEWDCLPASAFGAPHRRDRVWIIAYPNADRRRLQVGRKRDGDPAQPVFGPSCRYDTDRLHSPMGNSDAERWEGRARPLGPSGRTEPSDAGWWRVEPDVGRVAHGIPNRVDRLRALGNALVPQIAEWIGRRLMETA